MRDSGLAAHVFVLDHGGLETPLVGLLIVWLATELAQDSSQAQWRAACASTLLILVRPEGFVYLGAVLLAGLARRRSATFWRRNLALPLVAWLVLTTARWLVIGYAFPLPVFAKAGDGSSFARLVNGLTYVHAFVNASRFGAFAVICLLFCTISLLLRARHERPLKVAPGHLTPVLLSLNVLAAAAISGGDWMAFFRFVAPAVPLLSIVMVQTVWQGLSRLTQSLQLQQAVALTSLFVVPWLTQEKSGAFPMFMHNTCLQTSIDNLWDPKRGSSLGERVRRLNHPYLRDEQQLLPFLQGPLKQVLATRPNLNIASLQMGFFPYHLKQLGLSGVRVIDTFGIVDPELARLPGERTQLGLKSGSPQVYLNPASTDPVARAIQARNPDLVYVLSAPQETVTALARLGWLRIWSRREAHVFARAELVRAGGVAQLNARGAVP